LPIFQNYHTDASADCTYKKTSIANKNFNDLRLKCLINNRARLQLTEAMSAGAAIITPSNPETS
jgi:hypothetical protein